MLAMVFKHSTSQGYQRKTLLFACAHQDKQSHTLIKLRSQHSTLNIHRSSFNFQGTSSTYFAAKAIKTMDLLHEWKLYLYPCIIVTAVTVMSVTIKLAGMRQLKKISFFCPSIFIVDRLGDLTLWVTRSSKAKAFYTATRVHLHRHRVTFLASPWNAICFLSDKIKCVSFYYTRLYT